jgi:hypothetical protein
LIGLHSRVDIARFFEGKGAVIGFRESVFVDVLFHAGVVVPAELVCNRYFNAE